MLRNDGPCLTSVARGTINKEALSDVKNVSQSVRK